MSGLKFISLNFNLKLGELTVSPLIKLLQLHLEFLFLSLLIRNLLGPSLFAPHLSYFAQNIEFP